MRIFYKGKLRTLEEIYDEEKDKPNQPKYLETIKELIKLENDTSR